MRPLEARQRWFAYRLPLPDARFRLFCFPHAGGGASLFRAWPRGLADAIEVFPVQLPGRETRFREKPITQLDDLLPGLLEALSPELDRPYAFFGHSIGALVALGVVRRLVALGHPWPRLLIVSGHRAPRQARLDPPRHLLSDAELLEDLEALEGTPEVLLENAELMRLVLGVYRADLALAEGHALDECDPLPCPLLAYGGRDDPEVSAEDLAAWRAYTRAAFRSRKFPGGHFYLKSAADSVLASLARDVFEMTGTVAMEMRS